MGKSAATPHAARSGRAALCWIVVLGMLLRLAIVLAYPHQPESDELAYIAMADHLVNGAGLIDIHHNAAMYNAGYPLLVLAPLFLVFGNNLLVLKLANVLLGGVAIVLCHAVAGQAGAGRAGRLLAAAAWALYLPAALYSAYAFKENLLTPIMLAVLWCALRLRAHALPGSAIACGVLFGLIGLVGNAGFALAVPVVLAVLAGPSRKVDMVRTLLAIAVAAGVVLAPWLIRNQQVVGAAVLNTNGGFNFYLGNNPAATGGFVSISATPMGASWQQLRGTGEVRASQVLQQAGIDWVRAHPSAFFALAVKKIGLFWSVPQSADRAPMGTAERVVRLAWTAQYLLLAGVLAAGLFTRTLVDQRAALLWAALLASTALHALFYVMPRYREPVMPCVCILAALALERWWQRRGQGRQARDAALRQ